MIHCFKLFDTNIVTDVNSGAVHVFDDVCYDVIRTVNELKNDKESNEIPEDDEVLKNIFQITGNNYPSEEISEVLEEIRELIDMGQLYSQDIYREYMPLWDRESNIKALCLHISHDCNLRCKYCFADTGCFGGNRINMPPEVGIAAIDFVVKSSCKRKNIEIDFFGGEPLMNFDTVKATIDYAKSIEEKCNKKFNFTITTNGLLLSDEKMDYINKNMNNVVLSIDGRPETNDRMRIRRDNTGCYDCIVPKFIKLAKLRNQDRYYVRGTFTGLNKDFSKDVIHLADLGFKQISVEPVVAPDGCGYELKEEHFEELFHEYEELAKEYNKRFETEEWFNFFHFMVDLKQGPCVAKRLTGCGAGHEYVAVTPDGEIYPCHQFVGNKDYIMGSVFEKIDREDIQKEFKGSNVYTKEECQNCWAKFYCSGGCPANAYNFNKDINKPYKIACDLERKRVECSLWLYAQRNGVNDIDDKTI